MLELSIFKSFFTIDSPAIELLTFVFTLTIIFIAIVIFFENGDPSKTLAWLLILVFLPVLGFIIYLLIGRKFRKIHRYQVKGAQNSDKLTEIIEQEKSCIEKGQNFISTNIPHKRKLINLITNCASSPFTANNRATVYDNGQEAFASILKRIKEATHHIHMEFYIFRDDTIGTKIKNILIDKVKQGVKVRIIYDGMGSRKLSKTFIKELKENGIEIACFSPVYLPLITNRINYRNHRKIIVVDGAIGYVGGMNIGDEYLGSSEKFSHWRDTHLEIHGDAAHFLQYVFLQDWNFITKQNINHLDYYPPMQELYCEDLIQIAASGPDSPWEPIMQMYFSMIANADQSIYLTSPYFIPNESILTALKNAALSGLDVRMLLPGKPDRKLVLYASLSYIGELLEAGVRVYQYQKGFIHSKTLVIDGLISSIGTANMDIRSFNLNFEVNAFVYNKSVAEKLQRDFYNDLKNSIEINYYDYENRSLKTKFLESSARLFSPLL